MFITGLIVGFVLGGIFILFLHSCLIMCKKSDDDIEKSKRVL